MERYHYALEKRIFLLEHYYCLDGDYEELFAAYHTRFPNSPVPDRQCIYKLHRKFQRTGSVADAPRSGRPHTARTEENKQLVAQVFVEQPTRSANRTSRQFDFSRRSLHRIMRELQLCVYRPHLLQALHASDYMQRREFCEWYLIMYE